MNAINANTYLKDLRDTLSAFVAKYFDGNVHDFGTVHVTPPKVDVRFDRPQYSAQLVRPVISFSIGGSSRAKQKVTPTGWQNEETAMLQLLVLTSDLQNIWDGNEAVQECVPVVFNGASGELGTSGIRLMSCGSNVVQLRGDPSQDYQVSSRLLAFKIFLEYKRADTGQ